jgi:Ni/Co efflux regulator RcnB
MIKAHWYAASALAIALMIPAHVASAQEHNQFDSHDRQVTTDWYNQHKSNPPQGLRSSDRLSQDEESRLQPGRMLDSRLARKAHSAPRDLVRHLPSPPAHHEYVTIGGHVALIDKRDHHVRDVIRLH